MLMKISFQVVWYMCVLIIDFSFREVNNKIFFFIVKLQGMGWLGNLLEELRFICLQYNVWMFVCVLIIELFVLFVFYIKLFSVIDQNVGVNENY